VEPPPAGSAEALPLAGLEVVTFESRRAEEVRRLLESRGATVTSAPALREVSLGPDGPAAALVDALERGEVDVVVALTGSAVNALVEALAERCPPSRLAELLGRTRLAARGPKPAAALRRLGLAPAVVAPSPSTWVELLAGLDAELPVRGQRVAVLEYGRTQPELLAALEHRGAAVMPIALYRWEPPEDTAPLLRAAERLAAGEPDVALFTAAVQVDHLLALPPPEVARALPAGLERSVVVAAIGPTTRAALEERGIRADLVPERPKLGPLVALVAARAREILAAKAGTRGRSA